MSATTLRALAHLEVTSLVGPATRHAPNVRRTDQRRMVASSDESNMLDPMVVSLSKESSSGSVSPCCSGCGPCACACTCAWWDRRELPPPIRGDDGNEDDDDVRGSDEGRSDSELVVSLSASSDASKPAGRAVRPLLRTTAANAALAPEALRQQGCPPATPDRCHARHRHPLPLASRAG